MKKVLAILTTFIVCIGAALPILPKVLAEESVYIATQAQIYENLEKVGWRNDGTGASTVRYSGSERDAGVFNAKDFIFDFTLNLSAANPAQAILVKIRHNKLKSSGTGYMLRLSKANAVFNRYNDNDWGTTKVAETPVDFGKDVKVRIAANGENLWVEFDGVKAFEVNNAYNESGTVWFMHSDAVGAEFPDEFAVISKASAKKYDLEYLEDIVYLATHQEMLANLNGNGWRLENNTAIATLDYIDAKIVTAKDFVFDFTLDLSKADDNQAVIYKIRHNKLKNNGTGYQLRIAKKNAVLQKFNDNNWNTTKISETAADFSKPVKVRIVGNGANLWISFDGENVFELNDAYADEGPIWVIHSNVGTNDFAVMSDISAKKYSKPALDETGNPEIPGEPELSDELKALDGKGFVIKDGTAVTTAEYIDAEMPANKDFIFDFTLNMSKAPNNDAAIIYKLRHSKGKDNGTGYQLRVTANNITVSKYNDNDWNVTKLNDIPADFTKDTRVRIVGCGQKIWIALDGVRAYELDNAYDGEGSIWIIHSVINDVPDFAVMSNISLSEYDEEKANSGISNPGDDPIYVALKKDGWTVNGNMAVSDGKFVDANIGTAKNFILDFYLDLSKATDDLAVVYKLRHNKEKDYGTGYMLRVSKSAVALSKYNDNNWNTTKIGEMPANFNKNAKVRIAANEKRIWISVDGTVLFDIKDAYNKEGPLWVLHSVANPPDFATMSNITLRPYNDADANEGIVTADNDPVYMSLKQNGWTVNEYTAVSNSVFSDAELATVKDFILDFNLDLSKAPNDDLAVVYKLRHNKEKDNGTGYMLRMTKNTIALSKYNDKDWGTVRVANAPVDFSKERPVRVVANGKSLWVAVDNEIVMEINNAYAESGKLWALHGVGKPVDFAKMSYVKIKNYNESDAMAGIIVNTSYDNAAILQNLNGKGWEIRGDKAVSNKDFMDTIIAPNQKNFIFTTNIDLSKATDDLAVVLKIRHNKESGYGTGYMLRISNKKMTLQRYKDRDWATAFLKEIDVNFKKNTKLRIVCNGSEMWIAVDDIIVLRVENAYAERGNLWVLHSTAEPADFVTLSNSSVIPYTKEDAMAGIKADKSVKVTDKTKPTVIDPNRPANVFVSKQEAIDLFGEQDCWVVNGDVATNLVKTGSSIAYGTIDDYIMDFTLTISDEEPGFLSVNQRTGWNDIRNFGYTYQFYRNRAEFRKFNDSDYMSTPISIVRYDFTKPVKVRIAAHGEKMWVLFDGLRVFDIDDAENTHSKLSLFNGFFKVNTAFVSDLIIYKYDAKIAPEDEGGDVSDNVNVVDDNTSRHKLPGIEEMVKHKDEIKVIEKKVSVKPKKDFSSFLWITLGIVVTLAAATVVLIAIRKKRKGVNN